MSAAPAEQQPTFMECLMKPKDAAPYFGVEESTVKTWARTGRIPSARTPGGHIRVRPSDIAAMLAAPQNDNGPAE